MPATIITLLAGHPRLRHHYGEQPPVDENDEEPRAATPAQDRLTDSGSSSEDDAADDEDYVQRSSSDSSSSSLASSRSASPVDSSSDDEPVEPQDDLIRQSPYGPTFCNFFTTDSTLVPCLMRLPSPNASVTAAVARFSGIWNRSEKSVRTPETRRAQRSAVTLAEALLKIVASMKWGIFTRFYVWSVEARDEAGRRWSICLCTRKST